LKSDNSNKQEKKEVTDFKEEIVVDEKMTLE
jgi:hypothetical protein